MSEALKLQQFGGMLPAWDETLLPIGQAALSVNGYLFSGGLTGWRTPKKLRDLTNSAAKFAYRIPVVTSATATAVLSVVDLPLVGDTVQVGTVTYKFVSALSNPNDVLIGIDTSSSATNMLAAMTLDNGLSTNEGVLYADDTQVNSVIDDTGQSTVSGSDITVSAPDTGEAYNTVAVLESTSEARLEWSNPTYTGGLNATFDSTLTGTSTWLEFLDPDTTVMRSPVVDDTFGRYYFASPSLPPKYNTSARIVANDDPFLLGVPIPGVAPAVSVVGGGNQTVLGLSTSSSINNFTPGSNTVFVMPVTPVGAMSLNSMQLAPASPSSTAQFAAVVYDDNAGSPGSLIAVGSISTGCAVGIPITSEFTTPPGLLDSVQYWIGFMTDTPVGFQLADDAADAGVLSQSNTFTNGPPAVFSGSTAIPDLQMWAALTTSSVLETRAYLYTHVTAYDEESAPSPPTLLTGWTNGVWTIQMFGPPSPDPLHNITTIRLYRTVSGQTGATVYFWVGDIDIATNVVTTTTDSNPLDGTLVATGPLQVADTWVDSIIAQNNQIPSTTWTPPPYDLQGIISMPNGMAVGWRDNEVWFCEPYHPHAWPVNYVITTEFPIVGIGITGMSAVICTTGTPYVATGVNPSSMALLKLDNPFPCHSRGSVLSGSAGVYYASPVGLIQVSAAGSALNTTELWITRDKWTQLTPQKNLRAVYQVSSYFAFGTTNGDDDSVAQEGFTIELNSADSSSFTIWPQPGGHRIGFTELNGPSGLDVDNLMNDPWSGVTLLLQDGAVYYYDFTDAAPAILPYEWKSRRYQLKAKENMSALRVFFTIPTGTPAQNATPNTAAADDPSWDTLAEGQYGIIRIYADGVLVTSREITTSGGLLRVQSGFKAEFWQFDIQARVNISNIQVASSVKELANV